MALRLVPMALLVGALLPWPYGYFTFLRLVVCAAAIWLAVLEFQQGEGVNPWVVLFGLGALLFNPLVPVHLTREIWLVLDLGTAGLFATHLWVGRQDSG